MCHFVFSNAGTVAPVKPTGSCTGLKNRLYKVALPVGAVLTEKNLAVRSTYTVNTRVGV